MVAACARTFHVVSGVEWRSNVMRCRPPPPPNTGAHVTVQGKYHSDSKALMGMIDKEWRKPAILLPPPPAHPWPREQHGPSLGRVVPLGTWHTPPPPEGSKWGPTAGQRVRKDSPEVSPKEARQGAAARIPRDKGAGSPHANRRRTTHTLTHAHAPLPPGQQF